MATSDVEVRAIREGCEYWEVRVVRCGREFQAHEGNDEAQAREKYILWKGQKNVEKVGLFVDGEWAEPAYIHGKQS